ncbi:Predicted arabinose efflux permease, MFS family [Natronoarchaeum philippinense]|uniref:Predicted arabinose efflux permease, MFS family n=1 Tax=Natronoarchaeum philippinense TaxID=558529 RepID=A0A285P7V9_NATPI|nr:MFS transporter [Natronoarchaeum philippinense]SNZ17293.1 Predicted arabinose efflux permease, MFS family [Natronoarchaeum philippinense]
MDSRRTWTLTIFLFVVGDAVATQTRGPLLRSFQSSFGVSEALLGLVAPAGTIGFVVAILGVGFVTGRIDLRWTLLAGALATGLALFAMSVAPIYVLFLIALVGQGAAAGAFRGGDRPILSHLFPARRGRVFSLYALAWAIGAVAGPLAVTAVLAVADWRVTYALLGLWFLPLVAVLWRLDLPESASNERTLSLSELRRLLGRPSIFGATSAMTLIGAIEGIVFTWLPYYASTLIARDLANALLSVYLLAYIPGRMANTWLIDRTRYLPLALALTVLSIPTLAVAFAGISGPALFAAVFVAGLCVSGLFPTVLSYGVDAEPEYSGPINALTTGGTYLGIALAPPIVGWLAERAGVQTAMYLTVALTVGLLVVTAATWAVAGHPEGT